MLDPTLSDWLDRQADALDRGDADPAALLPRLAAAGVLGVAVEERLGGAGGTLADAVERVAAVAARSLTAAFVFWGQRAFIEYLLQSPNQELRQRLLGDLLAGRLAGATGLSNAMKFLSGIEALQVVAHAEEAGWRLDGRLPWVTNLRSGDFVVAAAIEHGEGGKPFVLAIPEGLAGLQRSADLRLLGLQCSNTAALDLRAVAVGRDWLLHDDARQFLPRVRPAFLGLQCGMAIGLARRAQDEVQRHLGGSRSLLDGELAAQRETLDGHVAVLHAGLASGEFASQPARLFRIRIGLAEAAANAVQLELQASGGKAYLSEHGAGFARRWRESAFVPIVTPSLVQLRAELLPGPQPAALAEPGEERRLRPRFRPPAAPRRGHPPGPRRPGDRRGRPGARPCPLPGATLRRHGPAHRAGPLPGAAAEGAAARRTFRRAGRSDPRRHAAAAAAGDPRARHRRGPDHPRYRRGPAALRTHPATG